MPSLQELEERYAQRVAAVSTLASKGLITAEDLWPLDYLGRYKVANEHWAICDKSARHALLNDRHHFVRACAVLRVER